MLLPLARGPVSDLLCGWMSSRCHDVETRAEEACMEAAVSMALNDCDVIADEDVQLSLWLLYELHYQGFDDVDPRWEWCPELLRVRRQIEEPFEAALRRATSAQVAEVIAAPGNLVDRLFAMVRDAESPPLAGYLQRSADREQLCEFLIHRSIYQLKEADPHTWAIPRLTGKAKVALSEIQYDEYGSGRPARMHALMFARTMQACGLDAAYGAYIDRVPGLVLATSNAMSMFGLHRRLRGAAIGHLGALETSSALPNRRYAAAVRRLGAGEVAAEYFDEHVEADAVHEQLAVRDVCAAATALEPELTDDIILGAAVCLLLDALGAGALLNAWSAGDTALRVDARHPTGTRA